MFCAEMGILPENKNEHKSTIIDLPMMHVEEDMLDMQIFQDSIVDFINHADTPITIAIQGEWGSGKTSVMNIIKDKLCDGGNSPFYGVFINAWQFDLTNASLSPNSYQTVVSILKSMISQLEQFGLTTKSSKNLNEAFKIFTKTIAQSAVSNFGVKIQPSLIDKLVDGLFKVFGKTKTVPADSNIKQLKDALNASVQELMELDKWKRGCIFFIDDLDRINPVLAVGILEILKNVFDFEHCVFVVAVDYSVIVKGLEPKLGKFDSQNENEFRHYFDKLVQLPIAIPVPYYNVSIFLRKHLEDISLFEFETISLDDQNELLHDLSFIVHALIGTNPRSLKRLINTLSLIDSRSRVYLDKLNQSVLAKNALVNVQDAFYMIRSINDVQKLLAVRDFKKEAELIEVTLNDIAKGVNSLPPDDKQQIEPTLKEAIEVSAIFKQMHKEAKEGSVFTLKQIQQAIAVLDNTQKAYDVIANDNFDVQRAVAAIRKANTAAAALDNKHKISSDLENALDKISVMSYVECDVSEAQRINVSLSQALQILTFASQKLELAIYDLKDQEKVKFVTQALDAVDHARILIDLSKISNDIDLKVNYAESAVVDLEIAESVLEQTEDQDDGIDAIFDISKYQITVDSLEYAINAVSEAKVVVTTFAIQNYLQSLLSDGDNGCNLILKSHKERQKIANAVGKIHDMITTLSEEEEVVKNIQYDKLEEVQDIDLALRDAQHSAALLWKAHKEHDYIQVNLPSSNKTVIVILACLQISYPKLYRFIMKNPDIFKWDSALAESYNLPKIDFKTKLWITDIDSMHEWQIVLLRFCQTDFSLKQNATAVLAVFNWIESAFSKSSDDALAKHLSAMEPWVTVIATNSI